MKKDIILGQIRQVLVIAAAFFIAVGDEQEMWAGIGVAIASIAWSIYHHEGKEKIFTAIRKMLVLVPAALVALDVITADKAVEITSLIVAVMTLIWSFMSSGGKKSDAGFTVMILFCCMLTCSCGGIVDNAPKGAIRLPTTGVIISKNDEGKTKLYADSHTVLKLVSGFKRLVEGERIEQIIITPQK